MYGHKKIYKNVHHFGHTLFQFDRKIKNTCKISLENTSILSLRQKLRAQDHYFHFSPLNRLFNQLDIMQSYSYLLISTNMSYWGSNTSRPLLFVRQKKFWKIKFFHAQNQDFPNFTLPFIMTWPPNFPQDVNTFLWSFWPKHSESEIKFFPNWP